VLPIFSMVKLRRFSGLYNTLGGVEELEKSSMPKCGDEPVVLIKGTASVSWVPEVDPK